MGGKIAAFIARGEDWLVCGTYSDCSLGGGLSQPF